MGLPFVKRLRRFLIATKSDLIYAKVEIGHYFEGQAIKELYLFAVMELGSNILKHAQSSGELWLVERQGLLCLVACDRGKGISNIELALQKGYSTYHESSLGIGLSSLLATDGFILSIVSMQDKQLRGTIVWFGPKGRDEQVEWLSVPFDERGNGDFVVCNGQLVAVGDAAGHGVKAQVTATFVTDWFKHKCHSILMVDDCFQSIHNTLIERNFRGSDLLMGIIEQKSATVYGVGNLTIWELDACGFHFHSLRQGSVGVHYGKLSHLVLPLTPDFPLLITSDGMLKETFQKLDAIIFHTNPLAAMCAALYFCASLSDDVTIVKISTKEVI